MANDQLEANAGSETVLRAARERAGVSCSSKSLRAAKIPRESVSRDVPTRAASKPFSKRVRQLPAFTPLSAIFMQRPGSLSMNSKRERFTDLSFFVENHSRSRRAILKIAESGVNAG